MDQEVAKTLSELEIKLQELERELTSLGRRDRQPSGPQTPGRLIDEAVEPQRGGEPERAAGPQLGAEADDERARAVDSAFGGPAVFGGEEVPAQGATIERESAFPVSETAYGEIATGAARGPATSLPPGVFPPGSAGESSPPHGPPLPPPGPVPTDRPPMAAAHAAAVAAAIPPAPRPQPPPLPQPIERAELVRFREKLQRTMEDLLDEYSKLLSPKPPQ